MISARTSPATAKPGRSADAMSRSQRIPSAPRGTQPAAQRPYQFLMYQRTSWKGQRSSGRGPGTGRPSPRDQGRLGERPAADLLGDQEEHLAAVERRDRQEVDHGQVDAQDAQEVDQVGQAHRAMRRRSDDPDQAAQAPGPTRPAPGCGSWRRCSGCSRPCRPSRAAGRGDGGR